MQLSEEAPPPSTSASSDSVLFAESEFARMTESEADETITRSLYWGSETDRKTSKKLKALSEKQTFLFSFWRSQDQQQHSKEPFDAYRLFKRRVDEANKQFSYQKTPGWKSSRGRVWITYGTPQTIGNVRYDPAYKPYLIWQYDPNPNIRLRTGSFAEFDFVDRMGGGDFSLVNSNAIGENYDPNWLTTEALRLAH
jgi:GWxTD domain-containing protein